MRKQFLLLAILSGLSGSVSSQSWTLDSCLSYARSNNKELFVKWQENQSVKWDKKIVQAKLFPQISLSASTDYYWKIPVQSYPGELIGQQTGTTVAIPIGSTWMANYGIDAIWKAIDIETWQIIKLESLKQQATEASIHPLLSLLDRNVTLAFYVVQIVEESKKRAHEQHEAYTFSHQLIQRMYEQGLIDKISLNQSQSILNDYEEVHAKKTAELERCLIDLKFWMGYYLDQPITIVGNQEPYYPEHKMFEVNRLPDYEEQQAKIDIVHQQYRVSKSRFHPTLSLVGNYGQNGFSNNFKALNRSSSWYPSGFLGLRISVPLLSLTDYHSVKKQKALVAHTNFEITAHQESQRKLFLQENVQMTAAWQSLQTQRSQIKLAEENECLSRQKIEKGVIDMIQFKQIQQALIDSQAKYNAAKMEYLKIYVELNYLQSNKLK